MKLQSVEKFVDKAIPYIVVVLGIEIIATLVWNMHEYDFYLHIIDYIIIAFFVADLAFKWGRVHNMKVFIRLYWLDILAVFPFYWAFRVYEFFAEASKIAEEGQKLVHETLLIREAKIAKEIELLKGVQEGERIARFAEGESFLTKAVKGIQRVFRMMVLQWEVAHGHIRRASIQVHNDKRKRR